MIVDFQASDFSAWTQGVIRWYDATNALIFTQTQFTSNATTVSLGHYRFSGSAITKPSPLPTGQITITVAGKNSAGTGPESAPSAPFSITPPAQPSNVVVTDPAL